ncbi:MAG TPA: hypothetical protein PKD92_03910 [Novosphingobium sp.]|nr:hypothetical protein [Novosphingobium sp.]HMP55699.1 hypothetical protein [Novosphingobium sp.]
MPDIRISELPQASGVTADDLIPLVDSGTTRRATAAQFRDFLAAASGAVAVPHVPGRWYMAHRGVVTTGTAGASLMQLVPFALTEALTINALGARVTTAFSGGLFGLAIYAHDPLTGNPSGPALAQVTGLETTTTGVRSANLATPAQLAPGIWWAAMLMDNATAAIQSVALTSADQAHWIGDASLPVVSSAAFNAQGARTVTGSSYAGGFIDLAGASFGAISTSGGPALCFRVASVP